MRIHRNEATINALCNKPSLIQNDWMGCVVKDHKMPIETNWSNYFEIIPVNRYILKYWEPLFNLIIGLLPISRSR
jgi:hypothetical protein